MANQYDLTPPRTPAEVEDRRMFVMEKRREHMYWDAIVKAVEVEFGYRVTAGQLAEDFRVVMRRRAKELHEDTAALREMSIQQLDKAALAILPKVEAGNLDALETYLKIQTRKARLLGLDAPVQREDVTPRQRLTADELIVKMQEIANRLRAARGEAAREIPGAPELPEPALDAEVIPSEGAE